MDEISALLNEGKALMQQKQWSEASECFERILKMNPTPEVEEEAQDLAYDCFLMLSKHVPVQSIATPALGGWSSAETPKERRRIISEADKATGAYLGERLRGFEKEIDEILAKAAEEYKEHPKRGEQLYKRVLEEIDRILGPGCLGPATAAAAPLADRKRREAAELLDQQPPS
jgi:tetratricopeptide (TPR) repeat protein